MSTDTPPPGKSVLDQMYEELTHETPGEKVKATYDAWAAEYDAEVAEKNQYAMPARVADAMAAHAPDLASLKILDVGCGTGLAGVAMRAKGVAHIDGCDFSPGMLEKARATGVYARLFEADLNAPPIDVADGAYDAAIAVGVFAYAHLGETAFDEVLRCVKPGGWFCVTTNDHFYESGVLQAKLAAVTEEGRVEMALSEHGDHLPARAVGGWVFLMKKT